MKYAKVLEVIDSKVLEADLLKHPFYQAWSEGTLSIESLRNYAVQYYKFVSSFPRFLSAVHSNCDELTIRQFILENLAEEENHEKPHSELWINFGKALSLSREDLTESEPNSETKKALETLMDISRNGSYLEGSAALYAYESRVPDIADAKIDGLKKYYGISDKRGLEYFNLHRDVDVLHAEIWRKIISEADLTQKAAEKLVDTVERSMKAYNLILDGVQGEMAIA